MPFPARSRSPPAAPAECEDQSNRRQGRRGHRVGDPEPLAFIHYSNGQVEVAKRNISDNDVNVVNGTLKWSTKAAAPSLRAEAMGAEVNGKVYAFGGYVDRTYHPIARVDVYDVASNSWSRLSDMPFGALTHAGTTTDGNFVYLAGGYPGDPNHGQTFSTTNVWRYDTTNDSWTKMPSLPEGQGAGTLVDVDHVLYFFGGADPKTHRCQGIVVAGSE